MQRDWAERLALLQGGFDVVTGLWPILHLRSFEAVTGPKPEGWLVKTVGALITVIGGTLLFAGTRRRVGPEVRLLGAGTAAAFTAVDVIYTAKRRIPPLYLFDAATRTVLLAGWGVAQIRALSERDAISRPLGPRLIHDISASPQPSTLEPARH